jgi:hypothetical protein
LYSKQPGEESSNSILQSPQTEDEQDIFERDKTRPIPIPDIEPTRVIPDQERLLRDRKEKQQANLDHQAEEREARFSVIEQNHKAMLSSSSSRDLKNKKITYDHNGKVIMIKTLSKKG